MDLPENDEELVGIISNLEKSEIPRSMKQDLANIPAKTS